LENATHVALQQICLATVHGHQNSQLQDKYMSVTAPTQFIAQEQKLSEREAEILAWVALGKTNPEIGSILGISAFTVKNHVQRILKKLDVTNRTQAVGKTTASMQHG
jgi:DNA-binding CsgD family transcriptional regulator